MGGVVIDDPELGPAQTAPRHLPLQTHSTERLGDRPRRPFVLAVLDCAGQAGQRTRCRLATADVVITFLAPGPHTAEGLRGIARCGRDDVNLIRTESRVGKAGIDRTRWKNYFQLSSRQPLFIDCEYEPAVLHQRRAGIVPVPDAKDVQVKKKTGT